MRNQSIAGSALPDLSEAAEQEKGDSLFFPSGLYKTEIPVSVFKGGHFLDLWEKSCSSQKKDDDLFLCFCSSMPPISWQHYNKELIHFPSADGSIVKAEPTKKDDRVGPGGLDALLKFARLF